MFLHKITFMPGPGKMSKYLHEFEQGTDQRSDQGQQDLYVMNKTLKNRLNENGHLLMP